MDSRGSCLPPVFTSYGGFGQVTQSFCTAAYPSENEDNNSIYLIRPLRENRILNVLESLS